MARNQVDVAAPAHAVFALLADGGRYAEWVVGAKRIRAVEAGWPHPGARIHHTVGIGPLQLRDETVVTALDPGRRIVLRAKARPAGSAQVAIDVEATGATSRVTMDERPVSGLAKAIDNRLLDALLGARNHGALRRLKHLVERHPS